MAGFDGRPRVRSIDLLRGLAILLILPINLFAFALPEYSAFWLNAEAAPSFADLAAFFLVNFLIQGKIYPILALLFGVGAWFAFRSRGGGAAAIRRWLYRLLLVAMMGAAHVVFLFSGDILIDYAFCALILVAIPRFPPRVIPLLGFLFLLVPLGHTLHSELGGGGGKAWVEEKTIVPGEDDDAALSLLDFPGMEDDADRVRREGTWLEVARLRLLHWWEAHGYFFSHLWWEITGWMLIGYSLARYRLFQKPRLWRPFLAGAVPFLFAAGIPLQAISTLARAQLIESVGPWYLVAYYMGPILMALGYVALFLLLAPWLLQRVGLSSSLVAAGRMSLSLYILQSLLMTVFFQPFGLGWYGAMGYGGLVVLAGVLWFLLFLTWEAWARRFSQGPLEALLILLAAKSGGAGRSLR